MEDDCLRQSFQSVTEVLCTTPTLSRHGCTVNYTRGRMLRCKSSVPLCSADSASMSLAPHLSYEHLLLPHTSLNRSIIGQISISLGNVIIGIYCTFTSFASCLNVRCLATLCEDILKGVMLNNWTTSFPLYLWTLQYPVQKATRSPHMPETEYDQ